MNPYILFVTEANNIICMLMCLLLHTFIVRGEVDIHKHRSLDVIKTNISLKQEYLQWVQFMSSSMYLLRLS